MLNYFRVSRRHSSYARRRPVTSTDLEFAYDTFNATNLLLTAVRFSDPSRQKPRPAGDNAIFYDNG